MYIAPSNDWHLWEENFEEGSLNFTWTPWKYENTTRRIIKRIWDEERNQTNRTIERVNETELTVNLTFSKPHHISPYEVLDLLIINIKTDELFVSIKGERLANHELDHKVRR